MIDISIVTTLYNSEHYIDEFIDRSVRIVDSQGIKYEFIFVDDGSKDNSCNKIQSYISSGLHGTLIKLSKNYGHHKAIIAGLEAARGNYVFLIDVDLEEPPELLIEFYKKISQSDYFLVTGVQINRNKDKMLGSLFWKLLSKILSFEFRGSICTVRIMKQEYVQKMIQLPQKEFIIADFTAFLGYKQDIIVINKSNKGKSSYSIKAKIKMFLDLIFSKTGASNFISELSMLAFFISLCSFLGASFFILRYFKGETFLTGWLSIILALSFFSGLNFFFLSVILKLLSKIIIEVENKPRYNIEYTINSH